MITPITGEELVGVFLQENKCCLNQSMNHVEKSGYDVVDDGSACWGLCYQVRENGLSVCHELSFLGLLMSDTHLYTCMHLTHSSSVLDSDFLCGILILFGCAGAKERVR